MRLYDLIAPFAQTGKEIKNITVNNIQFRSKSVQKGDLYVAIKGLKHDGHDFIEEAVQHGAVAVVGEDPDISLSVPYFTVTDSREALGKMAAILYNHPSIKCITIGITGTNGKTTTSYMIRHLLESSKRSCSLFGTVTNYVNGHPLISSATTPDAVELQRMLSMSRDENVVMEVSSHGLHQKRVEGMEFNYAVFTNLSHDHLDYHKDIDSYFETKYQLFKKLKPGGEAIVNSSCPWGKRLIRKLKGDGVAVYTFGEDVEDDLQLISINATTKQIKVRADGETWQFRLSMPGIYNVENSLAATLIALRMGLRKHQIKKAFKTFKGVPGRFEMYQHSSGVSLVVDYAHTPEGLESFLKSLNHSKPNKTFHVFGFRGDGDASKRQAMMETSVRFSDVVILTFDDLNGVSSIEMEKTLTQLGILWGGNKTIIIPDRTRAIEYAWNKAKSGDLIAITGKGPEPYKDRFALPSANDSETIQFLFDIQAKVNQL